MYLLILYCKLLCVEFLLWKGGVYISIEVGATISVEHMTLMCIFKIIAWTILYGEKPYGFCMLFKISWVLVISLESEMNVVLVSSV